MLHCKTFSCLTVSAPTSVIVTNSSVIVGSTVTLTCTVELSPAVDIPVTVNTVWTGPARFSTTNTAQAMAGSTTTYTSTALVSSFGKDQSGNYNCIQLQSAQRFHSSLVLVHVLEQQKSLSVSVSYFPNCCSRSLRME